MGQNSAIEWTDHTFNPWHGCIEVSPGCTGCYARVLNHRYGFDNWGPAKTTQRRMMSESYWKQPLKWNRDAERAGERRRVFCASMADWLEDHPMLIEPRARLLLLIHDTPCLDWLLLTKRPEGWSDRLHEVVRLTHDGGDMIASRWLDGDAPPNVWLGTSVETQEYADRRIPHLIRTPAVVRFLSCEPLLGAVDLSPWMVFEGQYEKAEWMLHKYGASQPIDWIIVGGESGHGARPMHPDWARSLRDQAQAAGVSYFFKQHGEWVSEAATPLGVPVESVGERRCVWVTPDGKTKPIGQGQMNDGDAFMYRVGKKAAGRLLDGREWNEFPSTVDTERARVYTPNSSEQFERG